MVFGAGTIFVSFADAFRERGGDAAGQEGSDVQLLPSFKVAPDHDRDLGIELHDWLRRHSGARRRRDPPMCNCTSGNLSLSDRDSGFTAARCPGMTNSLPFGVAGPCADHAFLAAEFVAFARRRVERTRNPGLDRITMGSAGIGHV